MDKHKLVSRRLECRPETATYEEISLHTRKQVPATQETMSGLRDDEIMNNTCCHKRGVMTQIHLVKGRKPRCTQGSAATGTLSLAFVEKPDQDCKELAVIVRKRTCSKH